MQNATSSSRLQSIPMASSRKLPLFLLLLAAFLAAAPALAAQEYCGDSLAGLMECESFMFGGAAAPSPACCAAYEAALDADAFCLCYVADGTFGRATGYDVNVSDALRIPAACGQPAPPIELCSMQGLVLPPYARPQGTPAQPPATGPACPPPSPSGSSGAPPSFTSPPLPPAPTSGASPQEALLWLFVGVAFLWWAATV